MRRRSITVGQQNNGWERKSTQRATMRPTVRDLEWAAGFLEGEGSFTSPYRVSVRQVNREPLEKLQRMFGGVIRLMARTERWNECPWLDISGSRARGVMLTLFLLMSARRQAQISAVFAGYSYGKGPKAKGAAA